MNLKKYLTFISLILLCNTLSFADSKAEIDANINVALQEFYEHSPEGEILSKKAKGILVFPKITKVGFILGAGYGEGALLKNGKTIEYYSNITGSVGYQLGIEKRSQVVLFLEEEALSEFIESDGWDGGADASFTIATIGVAGTTSYENIKDPVVAFIFSNQGLMFNFSIEGSKITKLDK